jgi:predicted ATPase
MKINRLSVVDLHGYLSFELKFFDDLTILIGINGSGKTSAVRAIMALLTPAVRDLARLDFERLEVSVTHDNVETVVYATRNETEISMGVVGVAKQLTVPILPRPSFPERRENEDHELDYYRDQEVINSRHPVLERISQLPTPMFLDLERRAQVGIVRRGLAARGTARDRSLPPTLLGGTLLESLRDAQTLAEAAFRENLARQRELADKLKQDLILTHFRIHERGRWVSLELPTKKEVRDLRRRQKLINESLAGIGISSKEITETVTPFFNAVYELGDKLRGKDLVELMVGKSPETQLVQRWFAIQPQLERINLVIHSVEQHNRSVEEVFEPVERYLALVNQFLHDSGKRLTFAPTGDLRVSIEGKQSTRPITALSSGERQLVVILTHLAFNSAARDANVLIIDEPELSLHIRWQEQFVGALQGASEGLQLILATHSPSIIMDRDVACVDVMEARS